MTPPGQSEEAKAGEALIARLTELHEKATPGPWSWQGDSFDDVTPEVCPHGTEWDDHGPDIVSAGGENVAHAHGYDASGLSISAADATLITETRNALPALLAAIAALRRERDEAVRHRNNMQDERALLRQGADWRSGEAAINDLRDALKAVGAGDWPADPRSPHVVFREELLPRIAALTRKVAELDRELAAAAVVLAHRDSKVAEMEAAREADTALLREIEWGGEYVYIEEGAVEGTACPLCGLMDRKGHDAGCKLAARLRDSRAGGGEGA